MRISFETSAFIDPLGRGSMKGQSCYCCWHEYKLDILEDEYKKIMEKREKLIDAVLDENTPNWKLRAFDRKIVKRYSI